MNESRVGVGSVSLTSPSPLQVPEFLSRPRASYSPPYVQSSPECPQPERNLYDRVGELEVRLSQREKERDAEDAQLQNWCARVVDLLQDLNRRVG